MPPLDEEHSEDPGGTKERVRVSERLSQVEQGLRDLGGKVDTGFRELNEKTSDGNHLLTQLVHLAEKDDKRKEEQQAYERELATARRTWLQKTADKLIHPLIVGLGGLLTSIGTGLAAWWARGQQ